MNEEVELFGQMMPGDWAEMLIASQKEPHYRDADGEYKRIPYGHQTFMQIPEAKKTPCRHCDTIFGKLHEPGCDYEQCPKCNRQIMGCACEFIGHEWREDEVNG